MQMIRRLIALSSIMILAACAGSHDLAKLDRAQAVGSPYTRHLALEYRNLANDIQNHRWQWRGSAANAAYFARKGLAAADGIVVMPETLQGRDLDDSDSVALSTARAALVDVLESGVREIAPGKAALTQARFDCWILQVHPSCKEQFNQTMQSLKTAVTPPVSPAPAARLPVSPPAEEFPSPIMDGPRGEHAPVHQAMFLVFFDWNKHVLSAGSNDVLDAVALELQSRRDIKQIIVVGHADTSGSAAHNKALSLKRATAVHDALIARGIPQQQLRIEGHGEDDLLVKTLDNTREPANRRAQLTLE